MTVVKAPDVTRVLIAEPDPHICEMLSEVVLSVRSDAHVEVCSEGVKAVQWLKGAVPDLVIASRELPGVDDLSLLRAVRFLRKQPVIPFILLSDRNDSASVREAVQLAPTAYLTKPLNIDSLRLRLQGLLLEDGVPGATDAPSQAPGLTLTDFLETRREVADGAPLSVDVQQAIKRSQGPSGPDITLLEQALTPDPQLVAGLIAAANSAMQHLGEPIQTLHQALATLGAMQGASLASNMALKRCAILTDEALVSRANDFWALSQRTANYASTLARMLELDHERCHCAGLLRNLGDLAVLRCLQEWSLSGGALSDESITRSLEQYSAAFGSALRTRWRLPLELRELIAAVYQYNTGGVTREVLVMNLAGQMASLGNEEGTFETLAKSKAARLLKINASDLERLHKKVEG